MLAMGLLPAQELTEWGQVIQPLDWGYRQEVLPLDWGMGLVLPLVKQGCRLELGRR